MPPQKVENNGAVQLAPQRGEHPHFAPAFIKYRGVQILRLDYSGLVPEELPAVRLASLTLRGRRDLVVFDREPIALDWLAVT